MFAAGFWVGGDERYMTYAKLTPPGAATPGVQSTGSGIRRPNLGHPAFGFRRAYVQNSLILTSINPVLIYTINYSFNTLHERLNVYTRTGSVMTVYAVASDPVLTYTFNYSCKVLNERLNVYTRTGSVMTVYAVAIDPVLIYTIIFSFNTGSVMTVYAVAIDPVLIYTIIFSFNTLPTTKN